LIAGPVAVGTAVDLVDVRAEVLIEDGFVLVEAGFDVLVELGFEVLVEIFVVDLDDNGFEVEDDTLLVEVVTAAPCSAIPCSNNVVYPPSLHHVRYDAQIPVALGLNTKGIVILAPATKVDPTAGKFGEVYPFPTIGKLTLWYGIPSA
jgi:hypothetical protein